MMVMIKLVLYVAKFSSKLLNHQKLAKSFLSPTSSQKESNLLSFQSNFWKLSIGVISLRLRSCQFGKIRMAKNCNFIKKIIISTPMSHHQLDFRLVTSAKAPAFDKLRPLVDLKWHLCHFGHHHPQISFVMILMKIC